MPIIGERCSTASARPRHACRYPSRRGKQKVAGAASRIEHGDREQRLGWIVSFCLDAVEHRVEGAVEKSLHKAVGRVIATAGLAGVTFGFVAFDKGKAVAVIGQLRRKFEQTLVD